MSSLKVAVRVRPFNQRELDMKASLIVDMENKRTRLYKPKVSSLINNNTSSGGNGGRENYHDFTFDFSYWSFDENNPNFIKQEQVYNDLGKDVIDCAFQGYNACVFAYGQTGSGKTFTMMGSPDNPGLIPRICQELFKRIKVGQESGIGFKTHASYLEIYNERVKDLLGTQNVEHGLRIREHKTFGPYVENLSHFAVNNYEEIQGCLTRGNNLRTTASTNMNDTSSRSHAIFTITFVQAGFMNDMPSETVSKIHLVDLAGSERANATGATGQRLKEGAHINKSLVTLGTVISALAEQTNRNDTMKRSTFIPYRDSVLTWLLKDSLGGNSKTIMIATISPAECNYGETLSTLRYANRAKNIINKPTINEDPNVKLIRELREEINKLKSMLANEMNSSVEPSSKMLQDLMKKEEQEKVLTEEWTEKWKEAQLILKEQKSLGLRKAGVGIVLDSEMPHLIGIHNDITTGVTLYSLKEGETLIGTEDADEPQDIVLSGTDVQSKHCIIILKNGLATLYPQPNALCWLNASLIDKPTGISQGDLILLGRTNIFRFNNPTEIGKLQQSLTKSQLDISRLSLITASRENLLNNTQYNSEDDMTIFSNYNSMMKSNTVESCDENKRILETIENALKQLNIERTHMYEQYKNKVQKLSEEVVRLKMENRDELEILCCREQELLARKDMKLWERNNEKIQIDIVCKQISALQTQLDSKKGHFSEKELKDKKNANKLDAEIEEIKHLEEQVSEKERYLDTSTKKMTELDGDIFDIDEQINDLKKLRIQTELETKTSNFKSSAINVNDNDANCNFHYDPVISSSSSTPIKLQQQQQEASTSTDYESGNIYDYYDSSPNNQSQQQQQNNKFSLSYCIMHGLRKKMAEQKALIMKNLELEINKSQLDEQIAQFQELKKRYIELEKEVQLGGGHIDYCIDGDLDFLQNNLDRLSLSDESKTENETVFSPRNSICSLPVDGSEFLTIPNFVLRGAGKQTHYEYEIRINVDGGLILLRRYSRFRELHLNMKRRYGAKVAMIPFPRRELFSSNTESVAKYRRRSLEIYLRRLISVCCKIPQCPIYDEPGGTGVTKANLAQFSPFFKKGLFESGIHGTG